MHADPPGHPPRFNFNALIPQVAVPAPRPPYFEGRLGAIYQPQYLQEHPVAVNWNGGGAAPQVPHIPVRWGAVPFNVNPRELLGQPYGGIAYPGGAVVGPGQAHDLRFAHPYQMPEVPRQANPPLRVRERPARRPRGYGFE